MAPHHSGNGRKGRLMDADRFDTLLRSLTQPPAASRRGMGRFVIGLALGSLGLAQPAVAARSRGCKAACGLCAECEKGSCKRKNGRKRCQRGKCKPKANGSGCGGSGTCLNGGCATTCANPSPPGACSGASCTGPSCPNGEFCGTCDMTTEGQVVCGDLRPPCSEFQSCERSANCPRGSVCAKSGCCAFAGKPNVCMRPV